MPLVQTWGQKTKHKNRKYLKNSESKEHVKNYNSILDSPKV